MAVELLSIVRAEEQAQLLLSQAEEERKRLLDQARQERERKLTSLKPPKPRKVLPPPIRADIAGIKKKAKRKKAVQRILEELHAQA